MPKFAVKSWEDKILGALVRCRRKRIKDHATLKNKALALFFFGFFNSQITAKQLNSVFLLAVKGWTRPVGAPEPLERNASAAPPPLFRGLFDLLIPVLVTGIQPDQVLGLKEHSPRRRRGAAGSL
ncbi:hypothetical protein [Sinorhizobium meliloti]|uniref:hypothetical protein n=1 Tax=Rhizobium meliloti TaxID=382 RepID=UPI001F3A1348|nr:hypothetical protein [Sinorhizobium meliloti]